MNISILISLLVTTVAGRLQSQYSFNGITYNTPRFNDTTEVDLIYPRNDTYHPQNLFPIIVGIQNPKILANLIPTIRYELFSPTGASVDQGKASGAAPMTVGNFRWFWATGIRNKTLVDGLYQIVITVLHHNCTLLPPPPPGANLGDGPGNVSNDSWVSQEVKATFGSYFTVSNASSNALSLSYFDDFQKSDHGAACEKSSKGVAFHVVDYLPVPIHRINSGLPYCAVLAEEEPTPDPCNLPLSKYDHIDFYKLIVEEECKQSRPVIDCGYKMSAGVLAAPAWALAACMAALAIVL